MPIIQTFNISLLSSSRMSLCKPLNWGKLLLAATKQLYEWFSPSVCLSIRPPVTPFSLCSRYRITMKFSGVITIDRNDVYANVKVRCQGHRSQNPIKPFPDSSSSWKSPMSMKWCTKLDVAQDMCPIVFGGERLNLRSHETTKHRF